VRFTSLVFLASVLIFVSLAHAADGEQQKVDRIFATYDKNASPGSAVGVIRDGNFLYRKAYGMASLELSVPLSPQSGFLHGFGGEAIHGRLGGAGCRTRFFFA